MEILLNPGPVNLSQRVRNALLKPDLCHREPEFSKLQQSIRDKLLDVYDLPAEDWAAILLTGSGTSAMEAMMISMVPAHGKVLIIENGVYGERLSRIADLYHIANETLHYEWGEEIRINELEQSLHQGISHVAVVHHETTSGRLNELAAIAEVCASGNITLLVDAVSSFGAEELDFLNWNPGACAATANKCLHSIPGTSFVIVKRSALEQTGTMQRSLYLDLNTYLSTQDSGGTPFTQSVQSFYALDEALDEHRDEGGWQRRQGQYWQKMDQIRDGLLELGILPLLKREDCSCVLNSFHLPGGLDYQTLHDGLKDKGFIIYAGQGEFAKSIFRLSVMGITTEDDIRRLVSVIKGILA